MMRDVSNNIESARTHTAFALSNLRNAAITVSDVMCAHPELAKQMDDVRSQLWAMEGLIREIEAKLAGVYADVRGDKGTE